MNNREFLVKRNLLTFLLFCTQNRFWGQNKGKVKKISLIDSRYLPNFGQIREMNFSYVFPHQHSFPIVDVSYTRHFISVQLSWVLVLLIWLPSNVGSATKFWHHKHQAHMNNDADDKATAARRSPSSTHFLLSQRQSVAFAIQGFKWTNRHFITASGSCLRRWTVFPKKFENIHHNSETFAESLLILHSECTTRRFWQKPTTCCFEWRGGLQPLKLHWIPAPTRPQKMRSPFCMSWRCWWFILATLRVTTSFPAPALSLLCLL
jgi:hypothetical protein